MLLFGVVLCGSHNHYTQPGKKFLMFQFIWLIMLTPNRCDFSTWVHSLDLGNWAIFDLFGIFDHIVCCYCLVLLTPLVFVAAIWYFWPHWCLKSPEKSWEHSTLTLQSEMFFSLTVLYEHNWYEGKLGPTMLWSFTFFSAQSWRGPTLICHISDFRSLSCNCYSKT